MERWHEFFTGFLAELIWIWHTLESYFLHFKDERIPHQAKLQDQIYPLVWNNQNIGGGGGGAGGGAEYMEWRYARHRKSGNRGLWTLPHKKQGEHCKLSQLTALLSGNGLHSASMEHGQERKMYWEDEVWEVPPCGPSLIGWDHLAVFSTKGHSCWKAFSCSHS